MISVTGVTNNYSVQPALLDKHSRTLSWLSITMHWKSELAFYQKMINEVKPSVNAIELKREIENLENQVLYLSTEAIEDLRRRLRNHENRLAKMLEGRTEWDTQYYKEHDVLMESAASLSKNVDQVISELKAWKILREHARQR